MKFNLVYDRRIVWEHHQGDGLKDWSEFEDRIIPNGVNCAPNDFVKEQHQDAMGKVIIQKLNTRERDNEFTLGFLKKECDWEVNEIFLDEVSDKVLDNQINLYPIFVISSFFLQSVIHASCKLISSLLFSLIHSLANLTASSLSFASNAFSVRAHIISPKLSVQLQSASILYFVITPPFLLQFLMSVLQFETRLCF